LTGAEFDVRLRRFSRRLSLSLASPGATRGAGGNESIESVEITTMFLLPLTAVASFTSAPLASGSLNRLMRRTTMSQNSNPHINWTERLIVELEAAEDLAQRGAAVSDVLRAAKKAAEAGAEQAKQEDAKLKAKLIAAEERTVKALAERDAAIARVAVAEDARSQAAQAVDDMKSQLAAAEDKLERQKKEAALAMGELDDAFEFEQDRVAAMRQALEDQKRALKKAEKEAKLAKARESSANADAASVKREKTERERCLEEERLLLEGCLVDAENEKDMLLCRLVAAESKVGRKRRAVRSLVTDTASTFRKLASQLRFGAEQTASQAVSSPQKIAGRASKAKTSV